MISDKLLILFGGSSNFLVSFRVKSHAAMDQSLIRRLSCWHTSLAVKACTVRLSASRSSAWAANAVSSGSFACRQTERHPTQRLSVFSFWVLGIVSLVRLCRFVCSTDDSCWLWVWFQNCIHFWTQKWCQKNDKNQGTETRHELCVSDFCPPSFCHVLAPVSGHLYDSKRVPTLDCKSMVGMDMV